MESAQAGGVPRSCKTELELQFTDNFLNTAKSPTRDYRYHTYSDTSVCLDRKHHTPIMSWQSYVDTSLVGSGHVLKGCIASIAGDSIWATSADFEVRPEELKVIATILKELDEGNTAAKDKAFADGVYVAGVRYVATRIEDRHLYAAAKGKNGVCIVKSKQAIIISCYGENNVAGNATSTTEGLADYLIKQGY
jgi:profilin